MPTSSSILKGARALRVGDQDSVAYSVITLAELFAGSQVNEEVVRQLSSTVSRAGRVCRDCRTGRPNQAANRHAFARCDRRGHATRARPDVDDPQPPRLRPGARVATFALKP